MSADWSKEETKALISIWGQGITQIQLRTFKRNRIIYEGIARQMQELGHTKTWTQCRNKVKNMIQQYKKVNGDEDQKKNCSFYEELDEVLSKKTPLSSPVPIIEKPQVIRCNGTASQDMVQVLRQPVTPATLSLAQDTAVAVAGAQDKNGSILAKWSAVTNGISTNVVNDDDVNGVIDSNDHDVSGGNANGSTGSSDSGGINRSGNKRRLESDGELSVQTMAFLAKLQEQADAREEARERRRMILAAELEERRREQERKHEERMMTLLMGFMQQIIAGLNTRQQLQDGPPTLFSIQQTDSQPHTTDQQ